MKKQSSLSSIRQKNTGAHHFVTGEQLPTEFVNNYPEAIERTMKIANECQVEFPDQWFELPHFSMGEGQKSIDFLRELCEKQLPVKCAESQMERAKNRLDEELSIIGKMVLLIIS